MKPVFVIGHRTPDTDSICSAICYARLKQMLTGREHIPCRAGRNHGELCREEVALYQAILLMQQAEDIELDLLLDLLVRIGTGTHYHIELLTLDALREGLGHLILCQMGQQICYTEHRIAGVLADDYIQHGAVLTHHGAVQSQRQGSPLILLDTAIVVGLEECQTAVLIERIGLEVQPGGVDMADHHPHALFQILSTDGCQDQCLAPYIPVDPVAGLIAPVRIKGSIAGFLQHCHGGAHCFPLDFCMVEEGLVLLTERICPGQFSGIQLLPRILGAVEKLFCQQLAQCFFLAHGISSFCILHIIKTVTFLKSRS